MTFVLSRSVLRFTAEFITLYEEVHNGIGKRIDAKPLKLNKKVYNSSVMLALMLSFTYL